MVTGTEALGPTPAGSIPEGTTPTPITDVREAYGGNGTANGYAYTARHDPSAAPRRVEVGAAP
jgi:hypothetical protein